jgi:hypothetical protein
MEYPLEIVSVHLSDVSIQGVSELSGVNMLLKDSKYLVQQLLLMKVVELED